MVPDMDKKWWRVPYEAKYRGTALVEAETPEEARAIVESGDFDDSEGAERCDWGATGTAIEDK